MWWQNQDLPLDGLAVVCELVDEALLDGLAAFEDAPSVLLRIRRRAEEGGL